MKSFLARLAQTTDHIPDAPDDDVAAVRRLLVRLGVDDPEVAAMLGVAA